MGLSVLSKSAPYPVDGGQSGHFRQDFTCAWTTTTTTGTVPSGLRKVLRVSAPAFLQEPSDDEQIFFVNSLNGDGSLILATGELLSLQRNSFNPTPGLKFSFSITGYR